jgi:hypothetical protein
LFTTEESGGEYFNKECSVRVDFTNKYSKFSIIDPVSWSQEVDSKFLVYFTNITIFTIITIGFEKKIKIISQ